MPELRGSFAAATCRLRSVTRVLRVHRLSELPIFPGMPVIARFFGTTNPMLPTSKFVLFIRPRPSSTRPAPPCLANHHPAKAPENQSFSYLGTRRTPKRGRSLQTSSFSGNLSFFKIVRCFRGENRAPHHRLPPSHKAIDLKSTADVRHANSLFNPTTSILDSTGR